MTANAVCDRCGLPLEPSPAGGFVPCPRCHPATPPAAVDTIPPIPSAVSAAAPPAAAPPAAPPPPVAAAPPPPPPPRRSRRAAYVLATLSLLSFLSAAGMAAVGWWVVEPARQAPPGPVKSASAPAKPAAPQPPERRPNSSLMTGRRPVDDRWPLPQNKATAEKRRADAVAWAKQGTLDVFNRSGNANAPWADKFRDAITAYCERSARMHYYASGVEHQRFLDALAAAADAGCDDPLATYWKCRFLLPHRAAEGWGRADAKEHTDGFRRAGREFVGSAYSPTLRMHAAWNILVYLRSYKENSKAGVTADELAAAEKAFWPALREAAADPDPHARAEVADLVEKVIQEHFNQSKDRAAGWRAVDDALAAAAAHPWTRAVVEGQFLIHYAWDARGSGLGHTVGDDGWRLFRERLTAAREALEEAWKADPTQPRPAASMITVAMGLGFDRPVMEAWFRRAMTADPDCLDACQAKKEWLQTKWHGEQGDSAEFSYQCFRTGNWYAGLPRLAVIPYFTEWPTTDDQYRRVFANPGSWAYPVAVYDGHLAAYPADREARTRFAILAARSGQWAEADYQFRLIGDRPWPEMFASRQSFEKMRDDARREAAAAAAKENAPPRGATPPPKATPPAAAKGAAVSSSR